jgi:hypothetical protein
VSGRNNTAIAKVKSRIDRVNGFRLGNGIDFIHSDDFGVASEMNFVAASYYVQVSDSYVVINLKLLQSNNQIKMPNLNVVVDPALADIDNAESDTRSLSYFITKKQTIAGAF